MNTNPLSISISSNLRAASLGLVLAVATILFGQCMGIVFGLNEDLIKSHLVADAAGVQETIYKGDMESWQHGRSQRVPEMAGHAVIGWLCPRHDRGNCRGRRMDVDKPQP